jgi:hypothetical protein
VEWRGRRYHVGRGGRMVALEWAVELTVAGAPSSRVVDDCATES